jgi:hypothetical protein
MISFNAFNNPGHDIEFYNTTEWRKSEVPSMGGMEIPMLLHLSTIIWQTI